MTVGGNRLLSELGSSTLTFTLHLRVYVSRVLTDAVPGGGCSSCCVKLFPGFVTFGLPASQPDVGTASWAQHIPESERLQVALCNIISVEICL